MKRRDVIRSILGLPAIATIPAVAQQAPEKTKPTVGEKPPAADGDEIPKLALSAADSAADSAPVFFSEPQRTTLRTLAVAIFPAKSGKPGALETGVPEFLDFLISQSPQDRQQLYLEGLDRLQGEARSRFGAGFEKLTHDQIAALLAPLRQPWSYEAPSDELAKFLVAAKDDIFRATMNSREWNAVSGRRASGLGTYWYAVE